jgi:para-aminobenzoate synthetase/4-amino-4-deoxychorismate lyase
VRLPLASDLPPEEAVLWLRGDERPFALVGDWAGGTSLLGSHPVELAPPGADPFRLLDEQPVLGSREVAVGGGWFGWLGYRLGARIEQLAPGPPAPVPAPEFSLAFHDHVVLHDGERWWFEALWSPDRDLALRQRLDTWKARLACHPAAAGSATPTVFSLAANGADGHVAAVAACRERIAAGEIFQANLCVRLQARFGGDPADLFARALRARPRFGALIDGLVSLSPERFLRREGRRVWSEPIKGTSPRRGGGAAERAALDALLASAKDAAEHVMIVDLMRNDLGRVCAYGTVAAQRPRSEPHPGVWHLVSTVSGRLREGVGDGELLRATFPPGSVTGAPKIQAMKVIAELEATRREAYTGAIGLASPIAGLDLSVAIRTFELRRGEIWLGVGGGIVADSQPEAELAEALAKAAAPLAAIGARREPTAPRRPRPPALPAALELGSRPDPAAGIFETILIDRTRAWEADAHLGRLAASLTEVYGATPSADIAERVAAAAAVARVPGRARLRILADPDGSVELALAPEGPAPARPARLIAYLLPGGLGAHKWRDRALVDALAAAAPGTVPLLIDSDGLVLEAAHANVWIVEGATLLTPPADRRILPGVTRAALLAATPGACEQPIELARLARADAIFLTSSIAGRRAARLATCDA